MSKKEFVVSGDKVTHDSREETFMAETREEAISMFNEKHPGHPVDWVETEDESWNVVGHDEGTGEIVFEGDAYFVSGEEGHITLEKNAPPEWFEERPESE